MTREEVLAFVRAKGEDAIQRRNHQHEIAATWRSDILSDWQRARAIVALVTEKPAVDLSETSRAYRARLAEELATSYAVDAAAYDWIANLLERVGSTDMAAQRLDVEVFDRDSTRALDPTKSIIHQPFVLCPRCRRRSYDADDIRNRYCPFCRRPHRDMTEPA